ncbi:MAG: TIM barrel protein [Clostridia bacterium]|nr:TIM barrel protein [Clostridia bacterium]
MRLAAQLYTVREFCKDEGSIAKTLEKIKKIGYDAVQVSGFGQFRFEWLSQVLKDLELDVCCTHTKMDRLLNDLDRVIEEHQMIGTDTIGLGMFKFEPTMDSINEFMDKISPVVDKIYANGMKFVYHNHDHEFKQVEGKNFMVMQYLRDNTDPLKFNFLPDFYWIYRAGVNPLYYMRDYEGRYHEVVHFKDLKRVGGEPLMAEIFEGEIDYMAIYQELLKRDVKWVAVEQDNCNGRDPFESLKISFDNIKARGLF